MIPIFFIFPPNLAGNPVEAQTSTYTIFNYYDFNKIVFLWECFFDKKVIIFFVKNRNVHIIVYVPIHIYFIVRYFTAIFRYFAALSR